MHDGGQGEGHRTETRDISSFWGKLGRADSSAYHPLICHMIDVAAVARTMWSEVLSESARRAITIGLGMDDPIAARDWVAFLAGAHDLGKCSAAFTLRPEAKGLIERGLYDGLPVWNGRAADAHHGLVTVRELPEMLVHRFGVAKPVAERLGLVTGGHHGIFPSAPRVRDLHSDAVGRGPWPLQREGLLAAFASVFPVPSNAVPLKVDNATAMALAGLISVADWIGSDEEQFPYHFERPDETPVLDIRAYAERAADKATRALLMHGWAGWQQHAQPGTFAALFPEITGPPRPLQEAVIALAEAMPPGIVVTEAPMGEGKTEAALYLADRWGTKSGPRGFYVALPTQATSNQIFSRVRRFLETRYPGDRVNLQLLHGHASLSAEYELLRQEGDRLFKPRDVDPEDAGAGVGAAAWFAGSKRGLLGAFGVGTVDQGLLAVLQTKHVFVRHFGLAHRVVIFDEVHAYDTYMSTLLERLLEWLAALGSPVVLLSATLPSSRRRTLLEAYARGLGIDIVQKEIVGYPRITALPGARATAPVPVLVRHVDPTERSRRTMQVHWRTDLDQNGPEGLEQLGGALTEMVQHGGCAAVICNTVGRAQAVYRAIQPFFPGAASDGEPELDLLHARFIFAERQRREERALRRFGKPGTGVRPRRAVLVATQVIEQSLDVDFDLMVTDLAPVDLILQRAGRLHRHERPRPSGLEQPNLWVCAPPERDGVPIFGRGDTAVYDEHVLLRTWLEMLGRTSITIPDEIEPLVEAVYGERDCPADATPALRDRWETTWAAVERDREHDRQEASARWLNGPHADVKLWDFTRDPKEEDSPEFHDAHRALTRLAEPSVQVILLYRSSTGPAFDPDGRRPIDPRSRPNAATARRLLERAVTLTDKRVVPALLATPPPIGWQRSAVLRNSRLVQLDAAGLEITEREWKVRNDADVGVEVVNEAELQP